MKNIIKNWKMRPSTNRSRATKVAANGLWHDDSFGVFTVGVAVYFATMAREQIQRSMINVSPILPH
jgi:hypothetical protein